MHVGWGERKTEKCYNKLKYFFCFIYFDFSQLVSALGHRLDTFLKKENLECFLKNL